MNGNYARESFSLATLDPNVLPMMQACALLQPAQGLECGFPLATRTEGCTPAAGQQAQPPAGSQAGKDLPVPSKSQP